MKRTLLIFTLFCSLFFTLSAQQITTIEADNSPIIYAPPPSGTPGSDVVVSVAAPCLKRVTGDTRNGNNLSLQADFITCLDHLPQQTLAINPFTGNDDAYRLGTSINISQPITIDLRTPSGLDLDLFVMDGNRCITSSISATGSEFIGPLTWRPNYILVVDGYNSQQNSAYELQIIYQCGDTTPPTPCAVDALPIVCGSTPINGDTRNGSNRLGANWYNGCLSAQVLANNPFTGNDVVYRVAGDVSTTTPITIDLRANRDLDLFVFDCSGGTTRCVAQNTTPSGNESLTINWRPSYRIVIDGHRPSENTPYSLSVTCGDPCRLVVPDNDCDAISYRYNGSNGSLGYQFSVPSNLPNNGNWYAKRTNGSEINLGNGRTRNYTFTTAGEYVICYRYRDGNGCEQNCCKRIYIENPFNCNRITSTKSGNTYVLSIPTISSTNAFQWIDDATGNIVNTNANRISIPMPTPGACKSYSVLYYDPATSCYRVCCLEVCEPDCPANVLDNVCDELSFRYTGSDGRLSYQFSVSTALPNNGSWSAQRTNTAKINLGTGRSRPFTFSTPGVYNVCYTYIDERGCERNCCKQIYIEDPYACNLINQAQNGTDYRLSISGVNNSDVHQWIDDSNGSVIRVSTTQITVASPTPGSCSYYSVLYFDTNTRSFRLCCIALCERLDCGTTTDNTCNAISFNYRGSNGSLNYDFTVPSTLPGNGTWSARNSNGATFNLGLGRSRSYTFNSSGSYTICYKYIAANGCEYTCCKEIYIDDPYTCTTITQSRSGDRYLLSLPGVSSNNITQWTDDSNNSVVSTTSNQITVTSPPQGSCKFYSVWYFDVTTRSYRICCVELCGIANCETSINDNCNGISYDYTGNNGSLTYQFRVPTNLPNNGTWSARRVNGTSINLGTGRSRSYSFTNAGEYAICYTYTDSDGCTRRCCKNIYIDNPYNCNSISLSESGSSYVLSLGGINSNNVINWADDANGNIVSTTSNQVTVSIPAPNQCQFYSVRYFDPATNCYRICCFEVCGPTGSEEPTCCPNTGNTLDRLKNIYEDMCNDCGVEIFCYIQNNGAQGYYVRYGGACPESCSYATGMVFDCNGTLLSIDRFGNSSVPLNSSIWSCSNTTVPTVDPPVTTTEPSFLSDYPWLANKVDFTNCNGTSILVYKYEGYTYLYIQTPQDMVLYNADGARYCTGAPNYNCTEIYLNQETVAQWQCGSSLIEEDPCITNPADCDRSRSQLKVPNTSSSDELYIYPNPTPGKVFIQLPKDKGTLESIHVLDVTGKIIYQSSLTTNDSSKPLEIDLVSQASGMYMIQIDTAEEVLTKKIVIE